MGGLHRNLTATDGAVPIAAGGPTPLDLSAPLVQYGAVGVLAMATMFWAWKLYQQALENAKRERERADRLETEIHKLNADIQEKYIPVLTRVTDALQNFLWRTGHKDDP
ncbi:MAG: hypothetical protein JWO67_6468 [Streptosporangiaceae bacterium]|nr:hypothetical protein [Streptosporangiaceae bacterium]